MNPESFSPPNDERAPRECAEVFLRSALIVEDEDESGRPQLRCGNNWAAWIDRFREAAEQINQEIRAGYEISDTLGIGHDMIPPLDADKREAFAHAIRNKQGAQATIIPINAVFSENSPRQEYCPETDIYIRLARIVERTRGALTWLQISLAENVGEERLSDAFASLSEKMRSADMAFPLSAEDRAILGTDLANALGTKVMAHHVRMMPVR